MVVKIKSNMSNVPGNNFTACAISTIDPENKGTSNQYFPFLNWSFHIINNADEKE